MTDGERIAASLRAAVEEGLAFFRGVSEDWTARRPSSDAWCAREVIGHLIDSACNNHRRFIINQDADRLIVDPYEQAAWVARQRYAETPASELVATWAAYNRQLVRVIEAMPDVVLNRGRGPAPAIASPTSRCPEERPSPCGTWSRTTSATSATISRRSVPSSRRALRGPAGLTAPAARLIDPDRTATAR